MTYLAVAIGGFIGACLRFGISEWMGTVNGFPLSTLLINIFGSFFLAWFYTMTSEYWRINPHVRAGIGTGFVGAFTTFSTFTVEVWNLLRSGENIYAFLYLSLTIVFGLCFAIVGYWLAYQQRRLQFPSKKKEV